MVTLLTGVTCGVTRTPWLGRYGKPTPIRKRGAFLLVSAQRLADGSPCAVLAPGPEADPAAAAEVLSKIERAHNAVLHDSVPRVVGRGVFQGLPFLELDCDAVVDGAALHRILIDARWRAPLSSASAFASGLSSALRAAHEVRHGLSGQPLCLGRLSYANVLFGPSGRFYLAGFGHNFPVDKPCGLPDGWTTTFAAPEVAQGGSPSPMGDHLALHLLLRSLLPLVDIGPELLRVVLGEPSTGDEEILACLRWPDMHLLAELPPRRGTLAEADAAGARLRELCGIRQDPEGFAAFVRLAIQKSSPPSAGPADGRTLVLGMEASWIIGADGERRALGNAHRRIVTALAELHRCSPGAILTMEELLEIGWPGERPIPEAGANRVYVALTQLRRMGLRDLLERSRGGYRFVPDVRIRIST